MKIDEIVISGDAADRAGHVVLLIGLDGSILDANVAALECYGYSHDEMLSLSIHDIRAQQDREVTRRQMREAAERGVLFEARHRRADGTEFPVEVHSGSVTVDGEAALLSYVRDVGAAKRAEDSLSEREWRLASIVDSTRIGTWEWNVQTGETVYNERWARIVGHTLEELAPITSKTLATFVHPDDLKRSDELLQQHLAGELPYYDFDFRMRHKNGRWVWVHDRGRVMTRTADGRPLMVFGTHTDITSRKLTEDALLAADARSRAIIDASPVPMALTDDLQNITFLNAAWVQAFGYTREDIPTLVDWRPKAYPDPAYRAWVAETWHAALEHAKQPGATFSPTELTVTCKDGTTRTVLASAASFSDSTGGTDLLVLYDITQRKRAEAALRESEERYRSILNASPDGIAITDLTGRMVVVSPACVTMFGLEREGQLLGQQLIDFSVPDDRERAASRVALMLRGSVPSASEYRGLRADGSTFDTEVKGNVIRDAEGRPTSIVFVVRDVTERKEAEARRIEHLEEVANADRLTGLHNRRGLDLLAGQAIAQAHRTNQGVGLIFCDVDSLKAINDEFGHAQGDRALQDAASVLKFTLRSADAIARVGGDEFVVLVVGVGGDGMRQLTERLQAGFDFFNATNARPYELSMSCGMAWCAPGTPCRLEDLSAMADSDMYAERTRQEPTAPVVATGGTGEI